GAVGDHVGVDVLLAPDDGEREQEGRDVEADHEQERGGGAELVDSGLLHGIAAVLGPDACADEQMPPVRGIPPGWGPFRAMGGSLSAAAWARHRRRCHGPAAWPPGGAGTVAGHRWRPPGHSSGVRNSMRTEAAKRRAL